MYVPIPATGTGGYLAFITSNLGPGQNGNQPPACTQISFNAAGQPLVANGTVRAISGGLPFAQRAVATTDRLELYTTNDTKATGDGSDALNMIGITSAINLWKTLQPRMTLIYVDSAPTTPIQILDDLEADDTNYRPSAQSEAPVLIFAPQPAVGGSVALEFDVNITAKTPITFQNINVSTGGALATINAYAPMTFKNATIAGSPTNQVALNIFNTNLSLIDTTGLSYLSITARQSKISLYNLLSTSLLNSYTNTTFTIYDSDLSFGFNPNGTASAYTFSGAFTTTTLPDIIHAENSNVLLDTNTTLKINNGAMTLRGSKYLQHGNLAMIYPYPAGTTLQAAFTVDGGSAMNLYEGSTSIALNHGGLYGLYESGNSSVTSYVPFSIDGTAGAGNSCVYMDSSRFSQYAAPPKPGFTVLPAWFHVNCNSSGSKPFYLTNSALSASAASAAATNGDIEITSNNNDPIQLYNGSLLSLYNDQLKITTIGAGGINGDDIYVNNSRFSAYGSNINVINTGSWRGGITAEGGQISLQSTSSFTATTPLTSAAVYLTRASTFDAASSTIVQYGSTTSNGCVLLENPGQVFLAQALPTILPAQEGASALFYPNIMTGVNGSVPNTIATNVANYFGFTPGTSVPPVTVTSGTVDPQPLDNAIQNIINSENIGMVGNLRLLGLTCN